MSKIKLKFISEIFEFFQVLNMKNLIFIIMAPHSFNLNN